MPNQDVAGGAQPGALKIGRGLGSMEFEMWCRESKVSMSFRQESR